MVMLIQILLYISIFILIYLLINKLSEKRDITKINNESIIFQPANVYKESNYYKTKVSLKRKVEQLLAKSNITKYLPWVTVKVIFGISIFLGAVALIISYNVLNNFITSFVLFGICGFFPIYILEAFANYNNSKIERNFLYFLNILLNFAQLKDDVFFAFEKSIGYIEEPLNGYCKVFVEEIKRGLPIEEALENFKEKLDNNKFKIFLRNAQLCVRFGGSFLKLTENNLDVVKQLQVEKNRRKSETSLGRTMIFIMVALNVALAVYMFGLYPDSIVRLKTDFYGQVIVLINTINIFIVFYLSLKMQKLDY